MKIKFNWGIGIAVFYITFVILLLGNVVYSTLQRTDMVEEDYYNNELKYQEKIHKMERAKRLGSEIEFIQGASTLAIKFPEILTGQEIEGYYHFYKPSNSSQDKLIKIELNSETFQTIDTRQFQKGFWRVKIDWKSGDSTYYVEKIFDIKQD